MAAILLVLATAVPTSMWGQTVHADTIHADSVSADSARHTPRYTNIGISTSSTTADGHRVKTFNLGLLAAADTLSGFQLSLISGAGKMCGVQTGAVQTVAREMKGVQLSALNNIAGNNMRGLQLGGVSNMAGSVERGLQVSPLLNLSTGVMRGVQIGSYNYADSLRGVQLGVINIAVTHPRGVQMGLVNYTADTGGRKIGLVNINPSTRIDILAFGGNTSKLNAAVRFSNRSIYSMLGVGTHYMGLDKKFSGALSYRLGQYVWLTPHWMLGADLGFSHIETFAERSSDRPHRLYSLQAHLNTEWRFCKSVGAFASESEARTLYAVSTFISPMLAPAATCCPCVTLRKLSCPATGERTTRLAVRSVVRDSRRAAASRLACIISLFRRVAAESWLRLCICSSSRWCW